MRQETVLRRQLLVSLGLSNKEAILYDTLLKHGQLPAAALERMSGLKKNTYVLLKRLERRGLVQKMIKEGRSHYVVGSPEQLSVFAQEKVAQAAETKSMLVQMLPSLKKAYSEAIDRPTVQYFSGLEGLRAVFDEVYAEGKKEVLGVFGNEAPNESFFQEILEKYEPLRVERNIFARTISPDSPRARKLKIREQLDLKEKILVDPKEYPMPAEFDTWGETIAMMSFRNNDFQAILIKHPDLAQTLQSLIKLAARPAKEGLLESGEKRLGKKSLREV